MRFSKNQPPSWATFDRPVTLRGCDCPGCGQAGDFRAPKGRDHLTDYYWFCLAHVREYNARWDYFAGMNESDIEGHIRNATVWERPTWPLGDWQQREQKLRENIDREFFDGASHASHGFEPPTVSAGEREALAALELLPPVNFAGIKAQYRLLVKKHHPDANGGSAEAEEIFKTINHAFAILRKIYNTDNDVHL